MSKAKRERNGGRDRGDARQERAMQKEAERLEREAAQRRRDEQAARKRADDAEFERRRMNRR